MTKHTKDKAPTPWFFYALRCADDTLYAGVTTDLARRVAQHNAGRGARYTAGRRPVIPVAAWRFPDRGAAQRAEARFRQLNRARKLALIEQRLNFEGAPFCQDGNIGDLLDPDRSSPRGDRFCPRCGGSLETIVRPHDDRPRQVCAVCGRVHYRNAKPCAGALITRDGRVLLGRRGIQPYLGYWDLPGGFLEEDELPEVGAAREMREETGLEVRLIELLGFYMDRYGYDDTGAYCLNVYYVAEIVSGQACPADDVAELAWFAPDELPDKLAFEHVRVVLDDWVRWVSKDQRGLL